jgi:hypothetical protein
MALAQDEGWYVFISCSSRDLELARRVVKALEKHEIRCWLYKRDIPVGTPNWLSSVRAAIRECCAFIAIVTPDIIKSEPVHQELTLAFGFGKDILPIWADGDGDDHRDLLWEDFRDYQVVDVRGETYAAGMQRSLIA